MSNIRNEELDKFMEGAREQMVKIEWNDCINKYANNIISSKKVLNQLSREEYFSSLKNFFKQINRDIDNYMKNVSNPSYQIAIVGAIKAGKSTLINTLIGHELASVNVTPETATLTKFRYSKDNFLKIKFYTSEEWTEIWNNAKEKRAEIFLEEYEKLGASSVKADLINSEEIHKEFNSLKEMKEEIKKWTSSRRKEHYFVKELEIGLNDLNLPPQISLVDTPGLNDVIDYRSKITRDYIDSANAVIICVNAKTLRNEEMLTIAKVFSKARYKKDKIYVLGTQIDTMNSFEDWKKQRNSWIDILKRKEYFESKEQANFHLIGVSAYSYELINSIEKQLSLDIVFKLLQQKIISIEECKDINKRLSESTLTQDYIKRLKNRGITNSGIDHLKDIIQIKLLKNYNKALVKDYIEKYKILKFEIEVFGNKHKEILENKMQELKMPTDKLNEIIEKELEKINEFERINSELESKINETVMNFDLDFSKLNDNFNNLETEIKKIKID